MESGIPVQFGRIRPLPVFPPATCPNTHGPILPPWFCEAGGRPEHARRHDRDPPSGSPTHRSAPPSVPGGPHPRASRPAFPRPLCAGGRRFLRQVPGRRGRKRPGQRPGHQRGWRRRRRAVRPAVPLHQRARTGQLGRLSPSGTTAQDRFHRVRRRSTSKGICVSSYGLWLKSPGPWARGSAIGA
jgi:hypothetical protein